MKLFNTIHVAFVCCVFNAVNLAAVENAQGEVNKSEVNKNKVTETGINADVDNKTENQKINKPEENYLEMALNYINERNFEQARRYIQMAEGSGDEKVFQESQVWKMYLAALEGSKSPESGLNGLTGELYAKGLYYISDGWQNYYEKNPASKDLYALSLEYKEKLIVQYPESDWATLASMQLVSVNINRKNFDKALYYLLKYIDNKKSRGDVNKSNNENTTDDKAWFYMGQILENSREYRDLHKSVRAYKKVLENKESMFYSQAQNRISYLEKFYHVIP
jgi:tetratricopeptide (TPR) repeat protein